MEAVEVYQMYCALKAHFAKGDYDFVKYNGKSSATKSSFWKRNDRHFFVRTSRKYKDKDTVKDYLLSNFIKNQKGLANANSKRSVLPFGSGSNVS